MKSIHDMTRNPAPSRVTGSGGWCTPGKVRLSALAHTQARRPGRVSRLSALAAFGRDRPRTVLGRVNRRPRLGGCFPVPIPLGNLVVSKGFFRQEYWSGLTFPPPGDLPNRWTEPVSPALQADSFLLIHLGSSFSLPKVLLSFSLSSRVAQTTQGTHVHIVLQHVTSYCVFPQFLLGFIFLN